MSTTEPVTGAYTGNWVVIALLAMLALLPFGSLHYLPLAALMGSGIWLAIRHHHALWHDPLLRLALLVVALLWLPQWLALLNAESPDRALRTALRYLALPFAVIAVVHSLRQPQQARWLLNGLAIIAAFWALDALLQFVLGRNLLGFPYDGERLSGIFHPNWRIGILLAHLLPFVLEGLRRYSPGRRWLWLLLLPYLAVILLAGSRASWLTMLLALAIYALYLYRWHGIGLRWLGLSGAGVVLVAALATAVSPALQERLAFSAGLASGDLQSIDEASAFRMTVWSASMQVIRDDWLTGVGVRGFRTAALERDYLEQEYAHSHLYLLDVLVSTGLIGGLCYLLLLLALLRYWLGLPAAQRHATMAAWMALLLMLFPLNSHWDFYAGFATSVMWLLLLSALAVASAHRAPGKP